MLAITSSDKLFHEWHSSQTDHPKGEKFSDCHILELIHPLHSDAVLITVQDAHPANLSWIGSASGRKLLTLGVTEFGQSGNIPDLYRSYGIDSDAIIDATARASLASAASLTS